MQTFVKPNVGAGAKTLPASWYISPEVFDAKSERIFAREWLCVGREESIAKTGDFFTVERAGESLIVTRDGGGRVHAFYNVCRHRGTRICSADSGRFQGSIQCPYHAWTYGLDGTLKVARNMAEVPGFDRSGVSAQRGGRPRCGKASSSSTFPTIRFRSSKRSRR